MCLLQSWSRVEDSLSSFRLLEPGWLLKKVKGCVRTIVGVPKNTIKYLDYIDAVTLDYHHVFSTSRTLFFGVGVVCLYTHLFAPNTPTNTNSFKLLRMYPDSGRFVIDCAS